MIPEKPQQIIVKHQTGCLQGCELWNKMQPSGQRVEDKIKYAKQILKLYENY